MQLSPARRLRLVIAGEETLNKAELIKILAGRRVIAIEVNFIISPKPEKKNCFHSPTISFITRARLERDKD